MDTPLAHKQTMRIRMKERWKALTPEQRTAEGRSISKRVMESLPQGPLTICAFIPMASEPDIRPCLQAILDRGDRLFLPAFDSMRCVFRRIESLDQSVMGPLGVHEPPKDAEDLILSEVTHVLIPGLSFGKDGTRLGRGNGGYDRWLRKLRAANATAVVWAIAFDHQVERTVPTEAHDQPIDAIVTPRALLPCSRS